jgi:hypothetical protein
MTKKIIPLTDYISASDAAQLLSAKLGRRVRPGYIHKIRREDIEAATIRQRETHNLV